MAVYVVDDAAQRASNVEALDFFAETDRALAAADEGQERIRVAFDCEGVDLSRCGSIEIVTLVFDTPESSVASIFLVDVGKMSDDTLRGQRIKALKKLFECNTVEKIIHDCRMDCDALYHHCGIRVNNVLDTSCMHTVIAGSDKNLNDVLSFNGIAENGARDKSVYQRNPKFWATRPFTATMIEWASGDVDKLVKLADNQIRSMKSAGLTRARAKSSAFASQVVEMKLEQGLVVRKSIARFIGTGGANVRSLQDRTGTLIYHNREKGTWFVYFNNQSELDSVKHAMGY
jgi:DNA polymerase I-like protein with 3'-5' exonuclease and polymerase domains